MDGELYLLNYNCRVYVFSTLACKPLGCVLLKQHSGVMQPFGISAQGDEVLVADATGYCIHRLSWADDGEPADEADEDEDEDEDEGEEA